MNSFPTTSATLQPHGLQTVHNNHNCIKHCQQKYWHKIYIVSKCCRFKL